MQCDLKFLDELPDRNCDKCVSCCIDYEGWLHFQNCMYKIVKDPLFELFITMCIVLNTLFLALEHHGMSESIRRALDVGNKVSYQPSGAWVMLTNVSSNDSSRRTPTVKFINLSACRHCFIFVAMETPTNRYHWTLHWLTWF